MSKVNDWLEAIPSNNTRKSYKNGLKKFEKFYKKPIENLIESDNAGKTIERFFVWLKEQGYTQNTCRNLVNSPIQFLKYHGTEVKYRKSLGMFRTIPTTRDHRLSISEVQSMARVSDLREQILLETLLLGLRVSDVAVLKWRMFDVSGEAPIPIEILTQKEQVVARTFISKEFKELLSKYLKTLDKSNPYFFQTTRKSKHLSAKRINAIFKELANRAGIKTHGLFRWHIGRKLFLRTCAELGVNRWNAMMLCGKSVSTDIATYVNGSQLKGDFIKIHKTLSLNPSLNNEKSENLKSAILSLEKENKDLKTRISVLQERFESLEFTVPDLQERVLWLENKAKKREKVVQT